MAGEARDWSGGLPPELLWTIGGKIPPGPDAGAFRSTCPTWRSALPFSELSTPVIMLPFDPQSAEVTFFRATSGELFTINLPEARGRALCGSSRGWLALVDEAAAITLLNPFTGATRSLPPLDEHLTPAMLSPASMVDGRWAVPGADGALRPVRPEDMRSVFFGNVVLSAPPESGGEFVAMVAIPGSAEVAFCRVGRDDAPTWTLLRTDLECCVNTVVHCGGRLFVAVGCTGEISICDVGAGGGTARLAPSLDPPRKLLVRGYLELDGELLLVGSMVRTYRKTKRIRCRNRVYKCADVLAETPVWSRVTSMPGTTLFVSKNFMASFGGASVSGLRGNSVYFSEPLYGLPEDPEHCIEISDITGGTSELLPFHPKMKGSEALCWIRPCLWAQGQNNA